MFNTGVLKTPKVQLEMQHFKHWCSQPSPILLLSSNLLPCLCQPCQPTTYIWACPPHPHPPVQNIRSCLLVQMCIPQCTCASLYIFTSVQPILLSALLNASPALYILLKPPVRVHLCLLLHFSLCSARITVLPLPPVSPPRVNRPRSGPKHSNQTQRLTQSFPRLLLALPLFSPDCLRLRGARGAGAGGHRDGEAGRVPHLRGLLGAGARQRLQRACAHETVAEAQQEHLKIYIIYWLPATKSIFFMFFNRLHIINRKCKLFN